VQPLTTALPLVIDMILMSRIIVLTTGHIAEFTPGAYVPSDLDNFGKAYAPDIVGKRPKLVSIDGGQFHFRCLLRNS
jgi:hypothetical protein